MFWTVFHGYVSGEKNAGKNSIAATQLCNFDLTVNLFKTVIDVLKGSAMV